MISSESRTISGLRRSSSPSAPVANRKPATQRYQAMLGPSIASPGLPACVRAEDDAADRRDQQDDGGDLEREQVIGEEKPSDRGRTAERRTDVRGVREPTARIQPDDDD